MAGESLALKGQGLGDPGNKLQLPDGFGAMQPDDSFTPTPFDSFDFKNGHLSNGSFQNQNRDSSLMISEG